MSDLKTVLSQLQKAYTPGDLALALAQMSADVVWDISGPSDVPYTGMFYGRPGFTRFWWLLNETVSFHSAGLQTIVFGEDVAVGLGGKCGVVKATGQPYHYDWAVEYRFGPDGLISLMRQYFSADRLQAASRSMPEVPRR
jgi:ketosteroid isomerase-like protein